MSQKIASEHFIYALTILFVAVASAVVLLQQSREFESPGIKSHFYEINVNTIKTSASIPWVSVAQNGLAFGMSAGDNLVDTDNPLLGHLNPSHEIWLLGTSNGDESEKVAEIKLGNLLPTGQVSTESPSLRFRILDFLALSSPSEAQSIGFLVSFASADVSADCRYVNVAVFNFDLVGIGELDQNGTGKILFQSECFPASPSGDFRLHQAGGRVVLADPSKPKLSELIVAIGDFSNLSLQQPKLEQAARDQLGSVIAVSQGSWRVLVSGLRNPQGMTWFKLSNSDPILLTAEHGPRGGDEINIIKEGKDYGWPQSSYGTAYAPENLNDKPTFEGQIVRGELPLFSWLPSVAPSQLVQAAGPEFSKWWASGVEPNRAGDLIVSTLKDQSLHRLRIEEGAVRYVERIEVGERIRSLSQLLDGKLLLGTDSGKALLLSADTEWSSEEGQKIE